MTAIIKYIYINHLADAFIQRHLQMRTIEAIKTNKGAIICKCYDNTRLVYLHDINKTKL